MKIQHQSAELIIFESALYRTTCTLIIGADHLLLVDPNWLPAEIEFIIDAIEPYKKGRACYLAFTHSDFDHIIGAGAFPDYTTIAAQALVESATKERSLSMILDFDDKHYIYRDYPIVYPEIALAIDHFPQQIKLGSSTYSFYSSQGHNHDGIIIKNEEKQFLVVGDYLSNIEFPFIYYSFRSYLETLKRLEALIHSGTIAYLITGHGDHCVEQAEMQERLRESFSYLAALEAAAKGGNAFDLEKLSKQYPYPKNTLPFHHDNVQLVERELDVDST